VIGEPERGAKLRTATASNNRDLQFIPYALHSTPRSHQLVRATSIQVLFLAQIPLVVHRTFNSAPAEQLQQNKHRVGSTNCTCNVTQPYLIFFTKMFLYIFTLPNSQVHHQIFLKLSLKLIFSY